ncbi:hypothetical protein SRHO_G00063120 [Serrasalmus rhombeus]
MAMIEAGGRGCGVHELICARRVSPELLGVLSPSLSFMAVIAYFFFTSATSFQWSRLRVSPVKSVVVSCM